MSRWYPAPADLYAVVEHTPATILLESAPTPADSAEISPQSSPVTRLFTSPLRICVANQLSDLPALFAEIEQAVSAGHYAAGYFTYECAAFFEPTAFLESTPESIAASSPGEPLAWFGIYSQAHLFDHQTGAFVGLEPPALTEFRKQSSTESQVEISEEPPCPTHSPFFWRMGGKPQLQSPPESIFALTEQQYADRIHQIHALIRRGDVYQLNFTLPITVHASDNAAELYSQLRARQPAPYSAFLHTEAGHHILSFSPELFFRIEADPQTSVPYPCDVLPSQGGESTEPWVPQVSTSRPGRPSPLTNPLQAGTTPSRRITTRPMKGTAPRGRTTAEDRQIAQGLAADPKNRSENVMIVDLLRNDLGRLCTFGSVQVKELFAVERYPTLWQMTSTITGHLRPEITFQQIFRALFPCGSVTGAPKIHAMQLLSQLEPQPRGLYTGAIGFFSKQETVFNVAIRTLVLHGEQGTMGVGSGIVIDSNPADEWRECQLKAQFLTSDTSPDSQQGPPRPTPSTFSLVETMLWNGAYPLIELHLDRLEDSATYFAYPFNRTQTRAVLEDHAETELRAPSIRLFPGEWVGNPDPQSANPRPHKVRLLLNSDGTLEITSEPIPAQSPKPLRVRIANQRTDPQDPMYFHKTTHRPLYVAALQSATEAGYDEVLFLNHRNEVTESAIHNLFIEKDSRLFTPPIHCGLLPGVHRRHILATNPAAEEKILFLQDLRDADAIYLSNAVRGLRPAIIDREA